MANPFLVLGGIAVGIVTATFGVLQVPGWVASAQDAAAINDLANIRDAQAVRLSTSGTFANNFDVLSGHGPVALGEDLPVAALALARGGDSHFAPMSVTSPKDKSESVAFSLSFGTQLAHLGTNTPADAYCAVVQSASGRYFAVSEQQIMAKDTDSFREAVIDASCAPDTLPAVFPGEEAPEPEVPEVPKDPAPAADNIVFEINTLAAGCTAPAINLSKGTATVYWGDGTNEPMAASGGNKHTYDPAAETKTYKVTVNGTFENAGSLAASAANCITSVSHWGADTGTKKIGYMFNGAKNLTSVAKPPTSVSDMSGLFYDASSFNDDISGWDVSKVNSFAAMFSGATKFNQPIGKWDTAYAMDMNNMFYKATAFNQDLTNWKTGNVRDMTSMFGQATNFNGDVSGWNTSQVTSMNSMFQLTDHFNKPLNSWNTSNVKDIADMFQRARAFNQDLDKWDTSKVTSLSGTFSNANKFNGDIRNWNTANVTSMMQTFSGATDFNRDISSWNVGKVNSMSSTFANASSFNQPIGKWNVGSVTDMTEMLSGAQQFNQPLRDWNVSKVTSLYGTFAGATSFNQPIGSWNISSVDTLSFAFSGASSFSQDITGWTNDTLVYNAQWWDQTTTMDFMSGNSLTEAQLPSWMPRAAQ